MDGIKVVELTSWMAAPSAGALLADLGADVVKVEPIGGDPVRGLIRPPKTPKHLPDLDYSFEADNRGKRSIAVDLDHAAGCEVVRGLIDRADVFMCNLIPRRQARFGLDAPRLLARNPRLVHATFTGYGTTGPDADRPGYDVTAFFGRGAITDAMTEPGGIAPQARPAQGDHAAGLALALAITAALRLAERTGEGQVVESSLLATAAWTMATDLSAVLIDGRLPTKRDRRHLISPLANRFCCSDDRWIVLNMPEPHWWPRFCKTMGHPEWQHDERFHTGKARFDHMPELIDLIDAAFATATLAGWGERFDRDGLIWGPASTLTELAADPQAVAAGIFPTIDHPGGAYRTIAAPFQIAGSDVGPRGSAPSIGQHSDEVLLAAGWSPDDVSDLRSGGVIA